MICEREKKNKLQKKGNPGKGEKDAASVAVRTFVDATSRRALNSLLARSATDSALASYHTRTCQHQSEADGEARGKIMVNG